MEDVGSSYLENDIDNDFYYTLQHMQSYLYSNCRFFFDVLGGELTLDYIDFIDFTIYKINDNNVLNINRNYKYIYNNKIVLHTLKHFNILGKFVTMLFKEFSFFNFLKNFFIIVYNNSLNSLSEFYL